MSRDDLDKRDGADGAPGAGRAGPVHLRPHGAPAARPEDWLLTALDATGELILVRGQNGRVLYVNSAFLAAFGGERTDWIGRWFSVAPPVGEAGSRRYEMLMRTRSGPLWIEWDERLLPDEGGVISVGRDVTRRREAHEDLEASQKAKSLFFAAVTHELRTPLAGTLGVARLLDATPLRPDQADYVRSIAVSADHALAMVDDILDLSRLEAGKLDLRPEEVDVFDLVRDTVELAAPRAREKGLEMGVVRACGAPRRIRGDAARIKQILFNLIGNAVKFTATGGVRVDMADAPAPDGRPRLAISVSDTGPGISEADQEKLFEHFERGAAERNGAESGAGLGLAMVRRLVEAMESQMGVESRPGAGAKFWVVFDLPVLDQAEEQALRGRRLAVAAESGILRQSLTDQLKALGADVRVIRPDDAIEPGDADLAERDVLMDSGWTGVDLHDHTARTWHLVSPSEKDAVMARRRRPEDGWFVKPVRAQSLCERLAPGAPEPVETADRESEATRRPAFQPDVSGLCLLVAEDDPVNALIARKCLENLGIAVTLVTDGDSALEALAVQEFDAALLDQRMPGLDGPDVAREARRQGLRLPLIALTANASEADRKLCLDAGMDEFLSKPLDPDQLSRILLNLCRTENRASMGS